MEKDLEKALQTLKDGGTILYPTDTVWGIGCDAVSPEAVQKIYEIKQRETAKSMIVLLDRPERLPSYVDNIPDIAWDLIEESVSPLTIIYPNAKNLAHNLIAPDGSIGIRITGDPFCNQLISRFKRPIVSTSANFSQSSPPASFQDIHKDIVKQVDYVVAYRQNEHSSKPKPSGIIKVGEGNTIEVIRE